MYSLNQHICFQGSIPGNKIYEPEGDTSSRLFKKSLLMNCSFSKISPGKVLLRHSLGMRLWVLELLSVRHDSRAPQLEMPNTQRLLLCLHSHVTGLLCPSLPQTWKLPKALGNACSRAHLSSLPSRFTCILSTPSNSRKHKGGSLMKTCLLNSFPVPTMRYSVTVARTLSWPTSPTNLSSVVFSLYSLKHYILIRWLWDDYLYPVNYILKKLR